MLCENVDCSSVPQPPSPHSQCPHGAGGYRPGKSSSAQNVQWGSVLPETGPSLTRVSQQHRPSGSRASLRFGAAGESEPHLSAGAPWALGAAPCPLPSWRRQQPALICPHLPSGATAAGSPRRLRRGRVALPAPPGDWLDPIHLQGIPQNSFLSATLSAESG